MSAKLGNVSYQPDEGDSQFTKPFSENTAQVIDAEVSALIRQSYERTIAVVQEHKAKVEALALR
jgi:ATP-dependent Zn protease